jgi:oxygen-independent coproporphyrinogen-3 oxidase
VSLDPVTGLDAAHFGVYLHFPYCLSKCPYCDFASIAARTIPEQRYAAAIIAELGQRSAHSDLREHEVESIFIGGGTPSLWQPLFVAQVLEALSSALRLASRCEVTLEANPGAADAERFKGYRAAGVNRLSMGVQSFNPQTLAALGRAHDGPTALKAYDAARAAGFQNVSMDFIYGVHGQSVAQVEADARAAASLGAEHLSAYALTLDRESLAEEVPLAKALRRGEVHLPPDDEVVHMQRMVCDLYAAAGLQRYEISNYSRPGRHSRHNALYWTQGHYLALGVGATGTLSAADGSLFRYSNLRSAEAYLTQVEAGQLPEAGREQLTRLELFEERLAMGLRLVNGVDLRAICAQFGQSFEKRALTLRHLESSGLMTWHENRVALTPAGLDIHSAICARLM